MSDERVDDDAAADGDSNGSQGGHAAPVTPARPSGKRSRVRSENSGAGTSSAVELLDSEADDTGEKTTKVKTKKPKKVGEPANNPIVFVVNYLKQVVAELRKVIWPNRKQMGSYTSVVLAFLVFMVTLIGLVDLGLAKLVLLVFG